MNNAAELDRAEAINLAVDREIWEAKERKERARCAQAWSDFRKRQEIIPLLWGDE